MRIKPDDLSERVKVIVGTQEKCAESAPCHCEQLRRHGRLLISEGDSLNSLLCLV